MLYPTIICLVSAYLVGAIPFGLLIARYHKVDLRQVGSGNIGATNVTRTLGRPWGMACFFLDALKGMLPVILTLVWLKPKVLSGGYGEQVFIWLWLASGFFAILGHVFPIFIGFRGGKGVATSFGVALGLWPYYSGSALLALAVWAAVLYRWKYVSLASMVAAAAFPLSLCFGIMIMPSWSFANLWPLALTSFLIPLMVIFLHRSNMDRLRSGTERKIGQSQKK